MSITTLELPASLKAGIEALAAREGYSVSQFLASAAGEKLAVMTMIDHLRREAELGERQAFERYLAAVPDVPPSEEDHID
jgi:hypothetical protein